MEERVDSSLAMALRVGFLWSWVLRGRVWGWVLGEGLKVSDPLKGGESFGSGIAIGGVLELEGVDRGRAGDLLFDIYREIRELSTGLTLFFWEFTT